ncbi:MAG: prolyl oligopeptidase family serine peptidase [Sedimentisphaerales bacterium]|nr:prolyl oligopeptidase family serine peptidase [Sedimentisphaerales bacterium]
MTIILKGRFLVCSTCYLLAVILSGPLSAQGQSGAPGRGTGRGPLRGVYKASIEPNWFADGTKFWYRNNLPGDKRQFILVDALRGTRALAFDHERLAKALSEASGQALEADRLPFDRIEFEDDGTAVLVQLAGKTWRCDLKDYRCSESSRAIVDTTEGRQGFGRRGMRPRQGEGARPVREPGPDRPIMSPDGRWSAFVKDYNVYIKAEPNGQITQLSHDGQEGNAYGLLEWSGDSSTLVAWRIEPGDRKEVYLIRSSPPEGGRATFEARPYALPGDKFPLYELNLFRVADLKQIKPNVDRFEHEWEIPRLRWCKDGRRFAYEQVDRGHQRFRVIEIDCQTGAVWNVVDERSKTFIWTAHTENLGLRLVNWLQKTDQIIYASEMDGWRHLYLVDVNDGTMRQITKGQWVVRGIDYIDEDARQIWFYAGGFYPEQDPYFIHYFRVNFDGTGLVALTDGNGNHTIQYSPDRRYIIDTYSRVDMAPVHELRRTSDGKLVCRLEEADITELLASGWTAPEVFVAKGRDGKTDIWGIVHRPKNLDQTKKYPVIESIYAGPQGSFVPKGFSASEPFRYLTEAGFAVAQIDGMGTANRSKAFHDVCWKNLKDAGYPDRILWHKAFAQQHPWYDITRVGVFGTSAGGQNAAAGVLFYGDFYKAAVANSGCHDNRMDKASWNEQWMGYPVGRQYVECSNIENAARLKGRLFLVVGELDRNVPPESTMRFVDALIRANKDFDLLVIPNGGHGAGGQYYQRRLLDFFTRYLKGIEPPNRNEM